MPKLTAERASGIAGSASGATSILGSYQVCHNACMGIITLLGIFGIAVAGMPLLFLTKVALPFWIAAAALLAITGGLYLKNRCASPRLIVFNAGLVVAGVPFSSLQRFNVLFWSVGGALALMSLILIAKDRLRKRKQK